MSRIVPIAILFIYIQALSAQGTDILRPDDTSSKAEAATFKKKWYDSFSIRGYAQARYNRLLETNDKLSCEQCDKSWGGGRGVFLSKDTHHILWTSK